MYCVIHTYKHTRTCIMCCLSKYMYMYVKMTAVSEIRTNPRYGHPPVPRCPDKRGLSVHRSEVLEALSFEWSPMI